MLPWCGTNKIGGGNGYDVLMGDGSEGTYTFYNTPEGEGDREYDLTLAGEHHGNNTLNGGAGNDTVIGDGGDDVLRGGEGDDRLWGDSQYQLNASEDAYSNPALAATFHGNDRLAGEQGDDIYRISLHGNDGWVVTNKPYLYVKNRRYSSSSKALARRLFNQKNGLPTFLQQVAA